MPPRCPTNPSTPQTTPAAPRPVTAAEQIQRLKRDLSTAIREAERAEEYPVQPRGIERLFPIFRSQSYL